MAEAGINNVLITKTLGAGDAGGGKNKGKPNEIQSEASLIESPVHTIANGHVVCIDRLADSLAREMEDVPQYMCKPGHPGRISRIPENLREVDVKAYEPYSLSIGPYHYGKPGLQSMEKTKRAVLKCLLERKPELALKDYLKEIKNIEPAVRSFYSDVEMESEKFVSMLLLDSVYIVTLFCGVASSHERPSNAKTGPVTDENDPNETVNMINQDTRTKYDEPRSGDNRAHTPRWFLTLCMHDLFLLENQLPFFVLQKIHDLAYGGSKAQLIYTMKDIIGNMLARYRNIDLEVMIFPTEEVHHLLHLSHMFFRPTLRHQSASPQRLEQGQTFRLGSAMQLYEAGLNFEALSSSAQYSLLDITFDNCENMTMPCLAVDDNTNSLLRNLIALEQMKYPSLGLHVSAYAVFLLHLITIPEDVGLLRRKGIIKHHLASDKRMMLLVNRLSVGLSFDYTEDEYSLKPLFMELKRYTELRVPRWRAWLKHRYFKNPWTVISLLVASLFLLLTALQTYYTVYSYH